MSAKEKSGLLRYDDVVCLVTGHDAEWSRRHSYDPGTTFSNAYERVFAELRKITLTYKVGIEKASRVANSDSPASEHEIPSWLYTPLEYLPVGHADAMALTLFDDLDPIHYVTAHCSTTVEEVAVGFTPLVESIVGEAWPAPWHRCLVDLKEFFRQGKSLPPLLMLTRIKLGAIGSIGRCLPFLEASYRAIAADCLFVLNALKEELDTSGLEGFDIRLADLISTRVSFLDLQGQEEIGLLIATSNYSIAGALLSRIQSLAVDDVFAHSSDLPGDFAGAKWVCSAADLMDDVASNKARKAVTPPKQPRRKELADLLKGGHAFRWTRSSLAVSAAAFQSPKRHRVRGYIELSSEINMAVGHQDVIDKCVAAQFAVIRKQMTTEREMGPKEGQYTAQLFGHSDYLLHQRQSKGMGGRFLPTELSFSFVRAFLSKVFKDDTGSVNGAAPPRHITGFSSLPTVPVPIGQTVTYGALRRKVKGHYPVLQTILPVLRWRMVNSESPEADSMSLRLAQRVLAGRKVGKSDLCPLSLCNEPKKYLAPSSLLRTVQYLYQNFATLLANPYVFDSVLDLYDGFATLHAVLTKHLVDVYAGKNRLAQIPAEVVSQLARYIGALHRAMEHRLYRAFPEATHRDMDVDFRGGLNQLIFGADCLVKATVGLVKRYISDAGRLPTDHNFNLFGVVNRIDFEPEIVTVSLRTGAEPKARLAIVRSDVPHLCVIASYLDFIHEVGHLAFDERRLPKSSDTPPLLAQVPFLSASEEMLAEIYTNAFTTLLVTRDNPRMLSKHLITNFSLSTRHGYSLADRLAKFSSFFFSVFIVSYGIEKCAEAVATHERSWSKLTADAVRKLFPDGRDFGQFEELKSRFIEFVLKYGPFCWDFDRIVGTVEAEREERIGFLRDSFDSNWERVRYSFGIVIADVVDFYNRYVRATYGSCESDDPLKLAADEMNNWFQNPDNKGKPLYFGKGHLEARLKHQLDDTSLIYASLYCALKARMELLGEPNGGKGSFEVHVPLDQTTGKIGFGEQMEGRRFSKYLIRPNDSLLFCCSIPQRSIRLQRQITLLKTLWHISSRMKEDRFQYLIDQSISKLSSSTQEGDQL